MQAPGQQRRFILKQEQNRESFAYSAEIGYLSPGFPTIRCMAVIISNVSQQANSSKLNVEGLGEATRELTAAPYRVRAMITEQLD